MLQLNIDFSGLEKLKKKLTENALAMAEVRVAFALIFRSWLRKRYDAASKGDGTWSPLSPRTIARRTRGRGTGSPAILRDTGRLFASFNPSLGDGGSVQAEPINLGVRMMLGGSPLATLAQFAQEGDPGRNRPARTLLVEPPNSEREKMAEAAAKIVAKHAQ